MKPGSMDNTAILKYKKERVREIVYKICNIEKLPIPKLNFEGCPYEGGGEELAHSHPDEYKICISETQLRKQNSGGLEETVHHEITHLKGYLDHDSNFHKEQRRSISANWRPPSGVHYTSGEAVNEESKRIREDPERLAWVNEDSDLIKFLKGKTNHDDKHDSERLEEIQTDEINTEEENAKPNEQKTKKDRKKKEKAIKHESKTKYNPMTKEDIEKTRDKLGIRVNVEEPKCKMPLCHRFVSSKCEYCNQDFCKFHLNYLIATTQEDIKSLSKGEDVEKYEKYIEDYETRNGHPCINYTKQWNDIRKPIVEDKSKRSGFFGRIKDILGIED